MKFGKNSPSPLALQVAAQFTYVVLSFWYFGQQRSPLTLLALHAVMLSLDISLDRLAGEIHWARKLGVVAVTNSLYLNLEVYGKYCWPLFIGGLLAWSGRRFLRVEGRPIFNPSMLGLVALPILFPMNVTGGAELWSNSAWLPPIVLLIGNFVCWRAGTLSIAWSYLTGQMLAGIAMGFLFVHPFSRSWALAFLLGPLTFSSLLFSFHVISDPVTAPRTLRGRVLFGLLLAFVDIILRSNGIAGISMYLPAMLAHAAYLTYASNKRVGSPLLGPGMATA